MAWRGSGGRNRSGAGRVEQVRLALDVQRLDPGKARAAQKVHGLRFTNHALTYWFVAISESQSEPPLLEISALGSKRTKIAGFDVIAARQA